MKYYQAPTNAHRPDLHRNAAVAISARLLGARPCCFPLRPARAARLQSPVLGALQTPQGGRAADDAALLPATYPVLRPAAARRTGPGRASNRSRGRRDREPLGWRGLNRAASGSFSCPRGAPERGGRAAPLSRAAAYDEGHGGIVAPIRTLM